MSTIPEKWHDEAEILVVGYGGAGAATAITAHDEGADVLILEKAPEDFRAKQDVFGPPRPEWKLTHGVKASLDPHGIFSPGCLPGRK